MLLFIFEIALQFALRFNIYGLANNPVIMYNPYCDQNYWLKRNIPIDISEDIITHPILSYTNIGAKIPDSLDNNYLPSNNSELVFYGSSFTGHEIFRKQIQDLDLSNSNYSLPSYGLDQMYLSYLITEKIHKNSTIIFGFLLEDIDRMLFSFRDYNKVVLKIEEDNLKLLNVPIQQGKKPQAKSELLSFKTIKNLYDLRSSNYNFSASQCARDKKVALLKFIIKDLMKRTKENEQQIIFITFRFAKDFKFDNWRLNEFENILKSEEVVWLDSQNILSQDITDYDDYLKFYGKDNHLNDIGFSKIITAISRELKEQYK